MTAKPLLIAVACQLFNGCDVLGPDDGMKASFAGPFVLTTNYQSLNGGPSLSCVANFDIEGEVWVDLEESNTNPGSVKVEWEESLRSRSGDGCGRAESGESGKGSETRGNLVGTPQNFRFSDQITGTGQVAITDSVDIAGSRSAQGVTATVKLRRVANGVLTQTDQSGFTSSLRITMSGAGSWTVTLR